MKEEKKEEKKAEGEAKAEEEPKEEEKKEEKPAEAEKTEEKKAEEKPKEEPAPSAPAAAAVQYQPSEYSTDEGYPFDGYKPSQSYQPLYPDFNHVGYYSPQVPFLNPNYFKHVKIAY